MTNKMNTLYGVYKVDSRQSNHNPFMHVLQIQPQATTRAALSLGSMNSYCSNRHLETVEMENWTENWNGKLKWSKMKIAYV